MKETIGACTFEALAVLHCPSRAVYLRTREGEKQQMRVEKHRAAFPIIYLFFYLCVWSIYYVRVVALRVKPLVLDDVLEGIVNKATVAALVALGTRAIHQLLLRKLNKRASGNSRRALDRAGGRERPNLLLLWCVFFEKK